MSTTLEISDTTMRIVQHEAERQRKTVPEVVEATLRALGEPMKQTAELPPLPEFSGGDLLVDVADRNALYEVMDGDHVRGGYKPSRLQR